MKIYYLFILLILANYGANMYSCGWTPLFQTGKWVILILMVFVLFSKTKLNYKHYVMNPLASMAIFVFFAIAFGLIFPVSINVNKSVLFLCGIILIFVVAYRLANYFSYPEFRWKFLETLLLLARIITYSSFLMLLLGINKGRGAARFSGWTDNPNTLSMMLVPLFPVVLFYAINRRSYSILSERLMLIMMVVVLLATGTRGAALGIACSSVIILWFSKKWRIILIFTIFIVVSALTLTDKMQISEMQAFKKFQRTELQEGAWGTGKWGSGREEIWQFSIDLIKEKPWFGYGIGTEGELVWLAREMGVIRVFQGGHVHNSLLTILVEVGIVGFVPLLLVLIIALFRVFRTINYSGSRSVDPFVLIIAAIVFGCFVQSIFETWMISPGNMNVLIFWMSVFLLLGYRQDVSVLAGIRTKQ